MAAVANAKADYVRNMEEVCGGETPYMAPAELDGHHERFRNEAIKLFQETKKMGGDDYSRSFLERLDEELWVSIAILSKIRSDSNLNRFRKLTKISSKSTTARIFSALLVLQPFFSLF